LIWIEKLLVSKTKTKKKNKRANARRKKKRFGIRSKVNMRDIFVGSSVLGTVVREGP
jgi:hypothetical protein